MSDVSYLKHVSQVLPTNHSRNPKQNKDLVATAFIISRENESREAANGYTFHIKCTEKFKEKTS
jgi:hypothetical protein